MTNELGSVIINERLVIDILAMILAIEDEKDRSFVERLYVDHAKKMYQLANSILHNHEDAQDAVHNTIEIIINKIDRFKKADDENYLKKLIVVTCRNTALKMYNAKSRKNECESSLTDAEDGEIIELCDVSSDVERLVVSEESCKRMYEAINELELKYRDIISLRVMGFDNRDIADILGISVELVRKRTSRARYMLLAALGGAIDAKK